ncbi:hypothetical protein R2601_23103 [Salipiger bermudensis HTCC2601]|uniref:Uncharacterized protein n=1 Tax=Salipiger bermudensis (strain DSM 26914 / JCM 13377 / KCTC 12554 / HTCC2601) TaxID=314265 RepID=Q0FGX2_SALBH|nr:hypothetical protein R2601_23103 [Salipiger bermudensis HTCC2601]
MIRRWLIALDALPRPPVEILMTARPR